MLLNTWEALVIRSFLRTAPTQAIAKRIEEELGNGYKADDLRMLASYRGESGNEGLDDIDLQELMKTLEPINNALATGP